MSPQSKSLKLTDRIILIKLQTSKNNNKIFRLYRISMWTEHCKFPNNKVKKKLSLQILKFILETKMKKLKYKIKINNKNKFKIIFSTLNAHKLSISHQSTQIMKNQNKLFWNLSKIKNLIFL